MRQPSSQRDEPSTICVTGGTGFVGRHVVARLVERGDHEVRVLTRGEPTGLPPAATVLAGDLRDAGTLRRFVPRGATVLNFAYARGAAPAANLAMADNLGAAAVAAGARQLVHCSTAVVAGRATGHTIDESTPCVPAPGYQQTKLQIEQRLQSLLPDACPLTILRPTAVFGRGGVNLCATIDGMRRRPWLFGALRNALFADRRTHLVCVENVVTAVEMLIDRQLAGTFIVSDDHAAGNDHGHVTAIVADELRLRPYPRVALPFRGVLAPAALRLAGRIDTDPRRIYSNGKLRRAGFVPPLDLAEGIRRFTRWYVQAG